LTPGAEIVVVGGGAVGLSVTNALLEAGHRVTSVYPVPVPSPGTGGRGLGDAGVLPAASRAAGAMLGAFGEITVDDGGLDDAAFRFRLDAQRRYPGWLDQIRQRSGHAVHQAAGTYVIGNNIGVSDRSSIHRMKERADAVGEPAEYLDPADIPGLRPNQYQAPGLGLFLPQEHSVDADQLLDALVASANTYPRWHQVDAVVESVVPDGGGWSVETAGGRGSVHADHLVLCAGSRSWQVMGEERRRAAGLPPLYFGKGVSCLVSGAPPIPSTIRTPNRSFACGIHVVPRSDGLLYAGATNALGVDHELEQGIQPGELHNLFDEIIHQINTDLRECRIRDLRVGFRPIVAHGKPVIGTTDLEGLSVATGTYRDGVLMAPLMAEIIAAELTGAAGPHNPFPVALDAKGTDPDTLVEIGVRDIVSFLQEPRGELPYERAQQLRAYVTLLFKMAVDDGGRYATLRDGIRRRLREVPLNETMHGIFRDLVERDGDPRFEEPGNR
jgi:glycine/D-amino acid oxidase-like deaminating enzyme